MRHRVKKIPKLGRKPDHRKILLRNLATSLFTHGKIQTTIAKARAVEPFANHLISSIQGRPAQLAIRTLKAELFSEESMKKLLDFVQKNEGKKSGFTRVTRLAPRPGDASMKVFLELV